MSSNSITKFTENQKRNAAEMCNNDINASNESFDTKISQQQTAASDFDARAVEYDGYIALSENRAAGATCAGSFLSSPAGANLMVQHSKQTVAHGDVYFFESLRPPLPSEKDFDTAYKNYVNNLNIPESAKAKYLSPEAMKEARIVYNTSLTKCVQQVKSDPNRLLTPDAAKNVALDQSIARRSANQEVIKNNRSIAEAARKNAEQARAEAAKLAQEKTTEAKRIQHDYNNAIRMLSDQKYLDQYNQLVTNNKNAIQTFRGKTKTDLNPELFDLRNVNEKNFRGFSNDTAKRNTEMNSSEAFINLVNKDNITARQLPVAKSYTRLYPA